MPKVPSKSQPLPPGWRCGMAVIVRPSVGDVWYGDMLSDEVMDGKVLVQDNFPAEGESGLEEVPIGQVEPEDLTIDKVETPDPTPPPKKASPFAKRTRTPLEGEHLMVDALAGTGKTSVLTEGIRDMRGEATRFTPTEQQRAVWDYLRLSKDAKYIAYCSFSRVITEELKKVMPVGCTVLTTYGMGWQILRKAYPQLKFNPHRGENIIGIVADRRHGDAARHLPYVVFRSATDLMRLCKLNLIPLDRDSYGDEEECNTILLNLANQYGVELYDVRGKNWAMEIFELVMDGMEESYSLKDGSADYSDQVWMPIVHNLPFFKHDLLLVDEVQDLNAAQHSIIRKSGHRLVLAGDERQAVFGFTGADSDSMQTLATDLGKTDRGLVRLPLTMTKRCAQSIVKEVNKIVPEYEAFPDNPVGRVNWLVWGNYTVQVWDEGYINLVRPGDMVLCRENAPIIREAFKFQRRRIHVCILGSQLGQGLVRFIRGFRARSTSELLSMVGDWRDRRIAEELSAPSPSEAAMAATENRLDEVRALAEGTIRIEEVIARAENMFVDNDQITDVSKVVRLSTVHKAKGLESRRVFLIEPDRCTIPHPRAKLGWEIKQEWNLRYVAQTRAMEELYLTRR